MLLTLLVSLKLVILTQCCGLNFPPEFLFGAATSAYQVEGAWNVSDKGVSIWDQFFHEEQGDITCDSYHNWKRDVEMIKELGLDFYRFSLSWTRLLPNGIPNKVSKDGVRYYNSLIDELVKNGIEPMVTIYHWDLPADLEDHGGWTNPLIVDWFAAYSDIVFSIFGDRVKYWLTLNEPIMYCDTAYISGLLAPGKKNPGIGNYLCNKNALMAHATVWRLYDSKYRKTQNGKVSLSNHLVWLEAEEPRYENLTELAIQNSFRYTHAIFSEDGGWPKMYEAFIAQKCREEGHQRSRLPPFTQEEIEFVKGTHDFFGLNYYTSRQIHSRKPGEIVNWDPVTISQSELPLGFNFKSNWENTKDRWNCIAPEGLRNLLRLIKQRYGYIEIIITENGLSLSDKGLEDDKRIDYLRKHLEQVLLAIHEDDVNVTGYTVWSLMDNLEWINEFKFGLFYVDFDDPARKRTARKSAKFYSEVIKKHSLN